MTEKFRPIRNKPLVDMSVRLSESDLQKPALDGDELLKTVFGTSKPKNQIRGGNRYESNRAIRVKNPRYNH